MNRLPEIARSNQMNAPKGDVLLGARIRVAHDAAGESYHEGVVLAVEPMWGANGSGECLRVAVDKSVIQDRPLHEPLFPYMVVDTSIDMARVRLRIRKEEFANGRV